MEKSGLINRILNAALIGTIIVGQGCVGIPLANKFYQSRNSASIQAKKEVKPQERTYSPSKIETINSTAQVNSSSLETTVQSQPLAYVSTLREDLKRHEGLRLKAYTDTTGNRTIGYGHNLEGRDASIDIYEGKEPITLTQAEDFLSADIVEAQKTAIRYLGKENFEALAPQAKDIIENMSFQLGNRINQFNDLKAALTTSKDYSLAADAMENSKWYNQSGERSKELVQRMKSLGAKK